MSEWPKPGDKLFDFARDSHNNACLSRPSWGKYARSYYEGARGLAEAVWAEPHIVYLDSAIYPIAFLYRHYIELSLKWLIYLLRSLESNERSIPNNTHDVHTLWQESRRLLIQHFHPDEVPGLLGMDGCIDDLKQHDPTSFAFRYPTDRQGNNQLHGLQHINLRVLYETMRRVNTFLDCMSHTVEEHLDFVLEQERDAAE